MEHWKLADVAWTAFDPEKVDPDILKLAKTASLVEYNAGDYAAYLKHVFHDDPDFQSAAVAWAAEEVQHGEALARWARMADPDFDFERCFKRFTDKIKLPIGTEQSVRGSRTGELIARCIVEVGTSSFYSALAEATQEPVLREICTRIAGDEIRHFRLFRRTMERYQPAERPGLIARVRIVLDRLNETDDDELAYAYYAANHDGDGSYERQVSIDAYKRRAYSHYRHGHVQRMVAMIFMAIGLKPTGLLSRLMAHVGFAVVRRRVRRLSAASVCPQASPRT